MKKSTSWPSTTPATGSGGLIEVLTEMRSYLTWSEIELRDLTDNTLDKLAGMTDAEFDALELYPDFI